MTSPQEIDAWLSTPREGLHLEFKEATEQYDWTKLLKYCVAIANEGGGKLLLGVTDKPPRCVSGSKALADPEGAAKAIYEKLRVRVDVEAVAHPDGRVVVVDIPGRPRGTAYHLEGAYWMRSEDSLVPMSEDRLRQIFDEGKPDWCDEIARDSCTDEDVVRLLDTQGYFDLAKLPYPETRPAVLERLAKERLVVKASSGWRITNLGAVLFAKDLREIETVAHKAPRVVVYEGKGKLVTKLDQTFTRGYAVGFEELTKFVNAQVPTNEVIKDALREEVRMYPAVAVRELIANALIHQDFQVGGASVMIEIYADRMEVSNPGKPLIPTERFIDEYLSRNERLADMMRRAGICEEKGSGADRVVQAAELFQLPAPDFRTGETRTTAVLFSHIDFDNMSKADRIRACYQHCVLRYVTNSDMTNQTLRERFKVSEAKQATVSQIIAATVEAGMIKLAAAGSTSKRFAKYVPFWA